MSKRTRDNKSINKFNNGTYKLKTWKNEPCTYYTMSYNKSRAGVVYENRVRTDKLVARSSRPDRPSPFYQWLTSLPYFGGLF